MSKHLGKKPARSPRKMAPSALPSWQRRDVLRAIGYGGAALMLPGLSIAAGKSPRWENWSKAQFSSPSWQIYPRSTGELQRALKLAPEPIRPVGAGLSFADLCVTSGTHVASEQLRGVVSWNDSNNRARLRAGTRMDELGTLLADIGQALPVQPDTRQASIAGAIATGTHGSGGQHASLSNLVTAAELVTAGGERLQVDAKQNSELLPAVSCSLGALGYVTEVEMQNQEAFRLEERRETASLSETLQNWERLDAQNRHFEAWVFAKSERCIHRRLNASAAPVTDAPEALWDWEDLLAALVRLGHGIPPVDQLLQSLAGLSHTDSRRIAESTEAYSQAAALRYNALEYSLPQHKAVEAVLELQSEIRRAEVNVMLPLQLRSVAADALWVSPQYRQPSVAITVRQWAGADYRPLFAVAEPILRRHGGRPHWATMHSCAAADFAQMYPRWDDFLRLRKELDPNGRLLNDSLRRLFIA